MQKILEKIGKGIKGLKMGRKGEIGKGIKKVKGKIKKDEGRLINTFQELSSWKEKIGNFVKTYFAKFQGLSLGRRRIVLGGVGMMLVLGVVFAMNVSNIRGASFGWLQTDWSGGADTNAVANHTSNQTGWTKFFSKDANVDTTAGEVKMSATSASFVTTTDADFNAGTGTMTYVSGNAVMAKKPNGGSCTSNGMCIQGICQSNICIGPWIVGPCAGIAVYKQDVAGTLAWKNANTDCVGPQCATGLDASYPTKYVLVADNAVDFSNYPARNACKALGGRLPTVYEANCIYTNRTQYSLYTSFTADVYWTATEYMSARPIPINFNNGDVSTYYEKIAPKYVRCVQGL
ncbi:MAG: hypothetical protein Q7T51_00320 [Candidatus Moranbacteria bacterium]|nr:hypothetical protein [Candidatus Moranbacteria bacterium]